VLHPLVKGETLVEAKLAPKVRPRGIPWMRAHTIHNPDVAGLILPGNHVDVLLTTEDRGGDKGRTVTLFQDVQVLAVEQRAVVDLRHGHGPDPQPLTSVTLRVSPRQAAKLTLAQTRGKLHLSPHKAGGNEAPARPPARKIQVPRGMRAYTIQTPALGEGVAPGKRVDVLLTVGRGDKHPIDFRTFTVLKDVLILAVEPPRQPRQPGAGLLHWDGSVTLLVSPRQAARLTRADRRGALHFACAGLGDGEEFPLPGGDLLRPEWEDEPPPQQGPPRKEVEKPPLRIRILRGAQRGGR